jgi:phosphoglycerate dehydrogenase-like enzyme
VSAPAARLLVTLPPSEGSERAIAARLPSVPFVFASANAAGPWPSVEAMLTGTLQRELPQWDAAKAPQLRFVQRLYTGLDGFPFDRVPSTVKIAGNVGAFAPYVAEQAITLTLAILRNLPAGIAMVKAGQLRPAPESRSLVGRTVTLLGYGEIAGAIAARLRPFGTVVEGVNRDGSAREGCDHMFSASQLGAALARADVAIDCRPLTVATRNSVGAAELGRMKPDAVYVNVGRAGTVDEAALFAHLQSHPEFRVGLESWWLEDYEKGTLGAHFPFATLPNVIGTPHDAGFVAGSRPRILNSALDNLARFFAGQPPRFVVDPAEYRGVFNRTPGSPSGP